MHLTLGASGPGALTASVLGSEVSRFGVLWELTPSRVWGPSFLMRTHLGIGLFIRWLYILFCGHWQEVNQNGGTVHTGSA